MVRGTENLLSIVLILRSTKPVVSVRVISVSKSSHVEPLWTRENAEAGFTSLISDGMSADAAAYLRGVILDGAQEAINAEERTVAEIDIRVQKRGVIQDTASVVPNDLLNYLPADITEDWMAGVEEARDLLFSGK